MRQVLILSLLVAATALLAPAAHGSHGDETPDPWSDVPDHQIPAIDDVWPPMPGELPPAVLTEGGESCWVPHFVGSASCEVINPADDLTGASVSTVAPVVTPDGYFASYDYEFLDGETGEVLFSGHRERREPIDWTPGHPNEMWLLTPRSAALPGADQWNGSLGRHHLRCAITNAVTSSGDLWCTTAPR